MNNSQDYKRIYKNLIIIKNINEQIEKIDLFKEYEEMINIKGNLDSLLLKLIKEKHQIILNKIELLKENKEIKKRKLYDD